LSIWHLGSMIRKQEVVAAVLLAALAVAGYVLWLLCFTTDGASGKNTNETILTPPQGVATMRVGDAPGRKGNITLHISTQLLEMNETAPGVFSVWFTGEPPVVPFQGVPNQVDVTIDADGHATVSLPSLWIPP